MEVLAFILSLVAIVMAFIALQRTGGMKDLRQQMEALSSKTEDATKGAREATADVLRRLEHMVRGAEGQPADRDENPPKPPDTRSHA